MISDEQMDARLAEAGNQWRAANTGAYARETTPTETFPVIEPRRAPFRSRWTLLISAAAVVALLAGGGIWFANRPTTHKGTPAGPLSTPATPGGLTGTDWLISSVATETGGNVGDSVDASSTTGTLHISAAGSVTGSDACNSFSGKAKITGSTITFGDLAITAIGCFDPTVNKVAPVIDSVLSGAITWDIQTDSSGYDLILEKAGVGQLVYNWQPTVAPPVEAAGKMAGTWTLGTENFEGSPSIDAALTGGGSASSIEILAITADGGFKVQHRCYANSGMAVIGTGTADFGKPHLDGAIPCPSLSEHDMKYEQVIDGLVDDTLSGQTTWDIESGQLNIVKGGTTLTYVPFTGSGASASSTP